MTLIESMLNIYKRMDENNIGMVNNTKLYLKGNYTLGELDQAEKRVLLDWTFKCTLLTCYSRMYTIHNIEYL